MAKKFNNSADDTHPPSQVQMKLLELLLETEEAAYPWNTADPKSEVYFANREQEFTLEDWSEEEIATRSQTFFTQLEEIWSATTPATANSALAASNYIQSTLLIQFATVPQGWLEVIAARASQVLKNQQSMADKLVQCVQDLLLNWAEADLLVLARPFAYAMRGTQTEAIESELDNVRTRKWTTLSEIEKAKASLVIAKYALTQLRTLEGES